MFEDFAHLPADERLIAENEFLAMKLIAERGAIIHMTPGTDFNQLKIQNSFLRKILESESILDESVRVRIEDIVPIREKFRPISEISPDQIAGCWAEMESYLFDFGLIISSRSPRVTPADLYQFAREELTQLAIHPNRLPGMISCFVYDDFHPDYEYDACCAAVEGGLLPLFTDATVPPESCFAKTGLSLNGKYITDPAMFRQRVKEFRRQFDQAQPRVLRVRNCVVANEQASVKGRYEMLLESAGEARPIKGIWEAELVLEPKDRFWLIQSLWVHGIEL
jgi:hypothetical protein